MRKTHRVLGLLLGAGALLAGTMTAAADTPAPKPAGDQLRAAAVQYQIVNKRSGLCLTPVVGSTGEGAALIQDICGSIGGQAWEFDYRSGSDYRVRNAAVGRCVDLWYGFNHNGAAIFNWSCHENANQRWTITYNGSGYYQFQNAQAKTCLDVVDGFTQRGVPVDGWGCHGGDSQQWELRYI